MLSSDNISVNDLNDEDFSDPIALLDAIKRFSLQVGLCEEIPQEKSLLSVVDIRNKYGLSEEYIKSSILAGEICPAKIECFFSEEDVVSLAEKSTSIDPLLASFEKELEKMSMNYSYKPLLLLALLRCKDYCATVDFIVDFFFDFYRNRIQNGLLPEKSDSVFVQCPDDRLIARRTILRYPTKILSQKAFVFYDKNSDTVSLNPILVKRTHSFSNNYIESQCHSLLRKYYSAL